MRRRRRRLRAGVTICACVAAVAASVACGAAIFAPEAIGASAPSLTVRAATLVAARTGQTLYGIDPYQSLPIASATKLMTALLTLEQVRLGRVFTEPNYYPAAADTQIGLVPGERMTVHDLLLAMLVPSADDAAEDLAYNVGHGSVARFIGMMNTRARQLGLVHTHYSTPIGLDTPGNYSSASDLVKLAEFLRRTQPFFVRAVALRGAVLRSGDQVRVISNRNDLVGRVPWITGIKTGHTSAAGYVLVGSATKNGMTLLSAVLGTASESARDSNTIALLSYGFENFRIVTPVHARAILARPAVRSEPGKHADVIAAHAFTRVIAQGTRLTTRVEVPRQLEGPLRRHAVVGRLLVLAGKRPIARIRLLLAQALPAPSSPPLADRFIGRASTLVSLSVLFGAAIVLAVRRRLRTRRLGKERAETA